MEPVLENGWFDEEEAVPSESESSVGEETEALLYSLVHHKPPVEVDPAHTADPSLVEDSPSFSVSKRSKASRWDGVQGIIADPECRASSEQSVVTSSDFNARKMMCSTPQGNAESHRAADFISVGQDKPSDGPVKVSRNKRYFADDVYESGRTPAKQSLIVSVSERNQRTPLNDSLPALESNASERTPWNGSRAPVECDQSDSSKNQSSDLIEVETQRPKPNLRAVLEALAGYSLTPPIGDKNKKKRKKNNKKKNRQELSTSGNSNHNNSINERSDNESALSINPSLSKYNVSLSTPQPRLESTITLDQSVSSDVIELFTDSDVESDGSNDSIVVVEKPPKTPPPLIDLEESPDESENRSEPSTSLNTAGVRSRSNNNNSLIVHCSPSGEQTNLASTDLNSSIIILSDAEENPSRKRKRNNKRTQKRKKQRTSNDASFTPLWSDCESWTPDMARFYNQSWGNRDLDEVHRKMPGHPQHWPILPADRYGPMKRTGLHAKMRCRNCNQLGHLVNRCPDPMKRIVCHMCGEPGHREPRCPNKICLKCGKPSVAYLAGCMYCRAPNSEPCFCAECGQVGHYIYQCPTAWRRMHMVTSPASEASQLLPPTVYKMPHELSCCVCAKRGHHAQDCRRTPCGGLYVGPTFSNSNRFGRAPGTKNGEVPPRKMRLKRRRKERNPEKTEIPESSRRTLFRESYINFLKIT